MPHGAPDWGVSLGQITYFPVSDLAELAARLGSPDTWERGGRVMFADTFGRGLGAWNPSTDGAGASVSLSADSKLVGGFSCLLTSGSDGLFLAQIVHDQAFQRLSDIGLELSFYAPAAIGNLQLSLTVFDGTNQAIYQVRWQDAGDTLQYLDSTSTWVTIASVGALAAGNKRFHSLKLVADAVNQKYKRVRLGPNEYSLNVPASSGTADTRIPYLIMAIALTGLTGLNRTCHVGHALITQDEP